MFAIDGIKFKREKVYYFSKEEARKVANNWRKKGYYARVMKRQKNWDIIFAVYIKKR